MENKSMMALPPSDNDNNKAERIRSFDCAICCESLEKPGPRLECFTFGKLLINVSQLPYLEREHIYREFALIDQCFTNGQFDCDKVVSTICGHIFHSGCIREWFFVKRMARDPKCPLCNSITSYDECRILHPTSCNIFYDDKEAEMPVTSNETEYSDISCASSSWATDDEINSSSSSSDDDDNDEAAMVVDEEITITDEETQQQAYHYEDEHSRIPLPINYGEVNLTDNVEMSSQVYLTSDDPAYHPVFIPSAERNPGRCTSGIKFTEKFELVHILTLINVFNGACNMFKVKKKRFFHDIETIIDSTEDENLNDIDHDALVPLGYEFIIFGLVVGIFICAINKYLDIFKRKSSNEDMSRSGMVVHLFPFFLYASLCMYTTHLTCFR